MTMVLLQPFIGYLTWLLNQRQKRGQQITVHKVGASLLLLTKLRFEQEARKGWLAPPLNPPAQRRRHDTISMPDMAHGAAKEN